MEQWLLNLLLPFVSANPYWSSFLLFVAGLRVIMKPLSSLLREFVKFTPGPADDIWLDKLEKSKGYAAFLYILDWLTSIKLSRK